MRLKKYVLVWLVIVFTILTASSQGQSKRNGWMSMEVKAIVLSIETKGTLLDGKTNVNIIYIRLDSGAEMSLIVKGDDLIEKLKTVNKGDRFTKESGSNACCILSNLSKKKICFDY